LSFIFSRFLTPNHLTLPLSLPPSLPPFLLPSVAPLFEALSKAALMNPDPPEAGENEGDDELIFDQTAFAAAGGASEEQVGRKRLGMVLLVSRMGKALK